MHAKWCINGSENRSMTEKSVLGFGIAIGMAIVVIIALIPFTAKSDDVYFINGGGSSGGVESLTSSNSAISLNASSGNVLITPKMDLLCQITLSGSDASSLTCNNFTTSKRYLQISIIGVTTTNTLQIGLQFNGDTGTNYAHRASINGGADVTGSTQNQCAVKPSADVPSGANFEMHLSIKDVSGRFKIMKGEFINDGVNAYPDRTEFTCRHAIAGGNQYTSITLMRISGTGLYSASNQDTMITVWGYD